MGESGAVSLFVFAGLVCAAIIFRSVLQKTQLPPLIGFILLGVFASALDRNLGIFNEQSGDVLSFLEEIGIAVILFRVGLESNIRGLLRQLRRASYIWIVNVGLAMAAGFLLSRYALGHDLVASLYVTVAFAATSVGVTVSVWRSEGKLDTPAGEVLVDVAELDDISSVILMAILFGIAPTLAGTAADSGDGLAIHRVLTEAGRLVLVLGLFLLGAGLFSRFFEKPITGFLRRIEPAPSFMITVMAMGLLIAAAAATAGLSLAIGAFFAGLIFSRDPKAVHTDARFEDIYELFAPFFFIGIGLSVDLGALLPALGTGLILTAGAGLSKLVGTGLPVRAFRPWNDAWAIGLSMMARAEVAMLVMQRGFRAGHVDAGVYGAMIVVVLITAAAAPALARPAVRRVSE